jgi:hypothetical protein
MGDKRACHSQAIILQAMGSFIKILISPTNQFVLYTYSKPSLLA